MGVYIWNNLPSDYQEVEYIQSSGTQYIDTNLLVNGDFTTEIKYAKTSNVEWNTLIGTRDGSKSRYLIRGQTNYSYIAIQRNYNNTTTASLEEYDNTSIYNNNDHIIKLNRYVYIDGTLVKTFTASTTTGKFPYPLYIFAINNQGVADNYGCHKLYYMKIRDDSNNLVRDFIPCYRKSDSVIGLYDLVNNQFYTNSGTGTFTKGSDVNNYHEKNLKNAYIGEVWTPTSNTLAYYKFDWNLNDSSGNSRNLSMTTGTFSYSTLASGAKYVQTNKNAYSTELSLPFSQSAYTISFRLSYANGITNTEGCTVIEMWNSSNILRPVLYWASTSTDKFTVMNTGLSYNPSVSNSWHYYTITLDGSSTKLYVDGVLQGTASLPGITASTVYFRLNNPKGVTNNKMSSENKLSELIFENKTWNSGDVSNYYNLTKSNYGL